MDVQAQLAKAVQARFRQMNGIEEPTPPPSTMRQKVKEPVTIPRADPGAKNAAAAALAAKFGNLGGPPSSNKKVSPAPSGGNDEKIAAKYRKMMKVGMPEPAVRHKMMADGVPNHIIESVMKGDAPVPKKSSGGSSSGGGFSSEEEQIVSQYRKMAKVGMPEGAIRHKMSMAGVAPRLQDAVFAADSSPSSAGGSSGGSSRGSGGGAASSLSPQEEQIASQYRKMMKVGMPEGAVRHKMTADGVSAKIQDSVIAGESAGAPSSAPPARASGGSGSGGPVSSLSPEDEAIATQYRKMMKIKMPQGAIMQKMAIAAVPQHIQDSVLKEEVPASEPAPSSSSAMPVNPLAAMIASSGGIGSLKAAAPMEKDNKPSGMPGNPLAAAIAASGGMASLKKAAPGAAPVKSSSNAGGLLGELTSSGFKGSLKKASVKDRAPPKPSSSGGLLGELTASGFKGALKKSSDHRAPPKPSSSGGLLGELSASGFKGSLKKSSANRTPPMKSASTGNTDFNKLLEERRKRAEAASATGSTTPRNKLPPSGPPTAKTTQTVTQPEKEEVAPKKSASAGNSGFSKLFAGRKDKSAPTPAAPSTPKKPEQVARHPPLPPSNTKTAPPTKPVEKTEPVAKAMPVMTAKKASVPVQTVKTPVLPEPVETEPVKAVENVAISDAIKAKPMEQAPEHPPKAPETPRTPQKMMKSAGSHIAAMLSRRQEEKALSPPVSPAPANAVTNEPPQVNSPDLSPKGPSPVPAKTRVVVQAEAQVPPALAAMSKPSRTAQAEAPIPAAFAALSKPKPTVSPSTTPQGQNKVTLPPKEVASKGFPHAQSPPPTRAVTSAPETKSSPKLVEDKTTVVPKVAATSRSALTTVKPAVIPTVPTVSRPSYTTNGVTAVAKGPPIVPEAKPEPMIQVKTEEKVTQLSNGKQVLDVATTTVKEDGTHARERKRKTKNSDKKQSKPQDDGVEHHCACVVM